MIHFLISCKKYCIHHVQLLRKLTFMFILQHLLFNVTDPQYRAKPAGVSDVSIIFSFFFFTIEEFSSLHIIVCMFFRFFVGLYAKCGE